MMGNCNIERAAQTIVARGIADRTRQVEAILSRRPGQWATAHGQPQPISLGAALAAGVGEVALGTLARGVGQVVRQALVGPSALSPEQRERYLQGIFKTALRVTGGAVLKADKIAHDEACILDVLNGLLTGELVAGVVEKVA